MGGRKILAAAHPAGLKLCARVQTCLDDAFHRSGSSITEDVRGGAVGETRWERKDVRGVSRYPRMRFQLRLQLIPEGPCGNDLGANGVESGPSQAEGRVE